MKNLKNYQESINLLNNRDWKTLNLEERVAVLQSVENEMAERENRNPCLVKTESIPSDHEMIVLGTYNQGTKQITINETQLKEGSQFGDDYDKHLETVLHEGRHAYQDQAVSGLIHHDNQEELEKWRENMKPGNYIECEKNPKGYYNQPIEVDARNHAQELSAQVKEDQQKIKTKTMEEAKSEYIQSIQQGIQKNEKYSSSDAKDEYIKQMNHSNDIETNQKNSEEERSKEQNDKKGINRR